MCFYKLTVNIIITVTYFYDQIVMNAWHYACIVTDSTQIFKDTIFMVVATFIKIIVLSRNKCLAGFGSKGLKSIEISIPRVTIEELPFLGVDGSNILQHVLWKILEAKSGFHIKDRADSVLGSS